MNEQRVIIYISATKQTTTAKWHLEGMYPSDLWIAVLHDIADLKPFSGESKVSIRFHDRTREAVFYFGNRKLIQVGRSKLDFWIKKSEKESEEKSMLHNVTVRKSEKKKLEEFWIMRAVHEIREYDSETHKKKINFHVIEDVETDHEPTLNEIAQFLSDSKADFVSVVQNYRFENELPFC